ncbi:MAG: hypothetical protein ICV53_14825 [Flavisolibacter sp.]|nr:hypothetical protein [Flavisolibacter sp.]
MNRVPNLLLLFFFIGLCFSSFSQDTLPNFSVHNVGNDRVIIGWVNAFQNTRQISIQRSFDSLGTYKTILSVADPNAVQNGYADTKAPNDHMYYRIFYVLEGGKFYFTRAKKPILDTAHLVTAQQVINIKSGRAKTDSLIKKDVFVPSFYVYTNNDGYVFLNLPDADEKKYNIKFYEEDNTFLFEIKNIKKPALTLDKANFIHAGWFKFELYNDEKLVERHKFYLSKDF